MSELGHFLRRGKFHNQACSFPVIVFGANCAAVRIGDVMTNRKAQARSTTLRCEERIEDLCSDRVRYAGSTVEYLDDHPGNTLPESLMSLDGQFSALPHRLDGINAKVEEQLFKLRRVYGDQERRCIEFPSYGCA